jgi:Mg-chelatase subunit ChlD
MPIHSCLTHRAAARGAVALALLALAVLLALPGAPLAGARRASAQAPADVTNLDIVLIIDESGSMWERNDPQILGDDGSVKNPGWRIVAANLLAEWLATDQSGARHQVGVVMFGTDGQAVFPLQDIHTKEAQAAYQKALTDNHTYLGATDMLEALRLAKAELDRGRQDPNVKKAVIFLSDGVCEPKPVTSEAERRQCEADIRDLVQRDFTDYPIFTIALTSDAFKQDPSNTIYKNLWQEISATTGGDYYEPVQAEQELLEAFVKILQRLFGLPIQSPPPPVDAPTEQTFEVPADLLQIGFTTIKYEPDIVMTVIRPDGSEVKPDDPGVQYVKSALTESYSISRPPGGTWTVRLNGRGKVILITVPFPKTKFVIERRAPAAVHPQGKPMQIQVRVLDVDQTPKSPQELKVDVALPDGTTVALPLAPQGQAYVATLGDTGQAGTYTLRFSGQQDAVALSDQQSVKVAAVPWLKFVEPQPGVAHPNNLPVPVQAQLMLGSQPLAQLAPGDQAEVVARLARQGAPVDTQFLRLAPGGLYSGTLASAGDGEYVARIELSYAPASGEKFVDATEQAVTVQGAFVPTPTPAPTPVPPPARPPEPPSPALIAGIAGILVAAAVIAVVVMWRRSLPELSGSIEAGGVPYPLRGKGRLTIGAEPRNRIMIQGMGVQPYHAELKPAGDPKRPRVVIRSLDEKNLVTVNGLEVTSQTLENGDTIRIGDQTLSYLGPELFDDPANLSSDDTTSGWKF